MKVYSEEFKKVFHPWFLLPFITQCPPHTDFARLVYDPQQYSVSQGAAQGEMLSRVTSKTRWCICSFLFAHTCVFSVMMLSEPCTCCSGGAHQQHKQRVINIYHSIFVKLDTQLSRQLKAAALHPFEGQSWDVKHDRIRAGKGGLENNKPLFLSHCLAHTFAV